MTLIDRDLLLDWLEDERDVCLQHGNYGEASEASYIQKHVMEMPKEDVKPVAHAHWNEDEYGFYSCSNCGYEWDEAEYKTKYCPECGAKMEE